MATGHESDAEKELRRLENKEEKLDNLGDDIAGAETEAGKQCEPSNPEQNPAHDPNDGPYGKTDRFTEGDARKIAKNSGKNGKEKFDAEEIKKEIWGNNASKADLYLDELGYIYVAPKPKGGQFPSHYEWSGSKLSDFI